MDVTSMVDMTATIDMADMTGTTGTVAMRAGMIADDGTVSATGIGVTAIHMIVTAMGGTIVIVIGIGTATLNGATGNQLATDRSHGSARQNARDSDGSYDA
jgi:hypothetical protein